MSDRPGFRDRYRLSFGGAAAEYDRVRPSFPDEAIEWVLPVGVRDVVDVGAGTGKLTRSLAERGLNVTAVEPDPGMRAQLGTVLPEISCLAGSGEQIPLPDNSADLVTFAQSWHWVDPELASAEVARVLRPGGRLAMLWNGGEQSGEWDAKARRVEREQFKEVQSAVQPPQARPPFTELEERSVVWWEQLSKQLYADRVLTHSAYLSLSEQQRSVEREWIRDVLATHPTVSKSDTVELKQSTKCLRMHLPSV